VLSLLMANAIRIGILITKNNSKTMYEYCLRVLAWFVYLNPEFA
jgi:hypothetical protein